MKNFKSTVFACALAGLTALPGIAAAQDLGAARAFEVALASETQDLAPVRRGEDGINRLRMTDEEFTNEQAAVKFSPDGRRAVYVHMRTSPINEGTAREAPVRNTMQCALNALETFQAPDGSVGVRPPTTAQFAVWATDNNGNEHRNCNKPEVFVINNGKNVALEYNYQAAGSNDTKRYMKVYDWDLNPVTIKNGQGQTQEQVVVMAKNGDDCSMHQSGAGQSGKPYFDEAGVTRFATWDGCNGGNQDDGWFRATEISCINGAAGASECSIKRLFDLSLAQREERSRGRCTVGGDDLSFAVCTWTEGNTQPQHDGTWIAAVDLSAGGPTGSNADGRLLWKEKLNQIQTLSVNGEDREYYAMRAQHGRIMKKAADGSLEPTNEIIFQDTLNRGGNNNDKKGGRSDAMEMAVIKVERTGMTFTMPMSIINMTKSPMLRGLDGTHLSMAEAMFGKGDELVPGFTQLQGSQTGGLQQEADIRTIGYDPVAKTMVNLGQHTAGAPYDRHLYSNYLGNNPGNQGRNFSGADVFRNPFMGVNGNQVQFFTAFAVTGKAPQHTDSAIKPSAFISLFPIAFAANAPDPQGGYNDNVPGDETPDDPAPEEPDPFVPGGAQGGCSTGGGSTGGLLALGLGLALAIRRRRSN